MAVPALKMPTARARSFTGNHSLTALTPAGMLAASVTPSSARKNASCGSERARACSMLAIDQPVANSISPRRVPSQSTMRPPTAYITM